MNQGDPVVVSHIKADLVFERYVNGGYAIVRVVSTGSCLTVPVQDIVIDELTSQREKMSKWNDSRAKAEERFSENHELNPKFRGTEPSEELQDQVEGM